MNQVYIVAGARLLIGKYGGQLAAVEPEQLGAYLLKKLLKQNHFSGAAIDEVIVGNVIGGGGNVGRRIALASALPVTVPAFTIDRQCASGLESILTATAKIKSGFADCIVSGGVESTSRAPWLIRRPKKLYGQNPEILARAPLSVAPYGDPEMGIACEQLAQRQQISRLQQDQYAYRSQQHYQTALTQGVFEDELIPYEAMTQDESPRPQTTMAKLSTLPAAFKPDGQLTAGNSSPLNDGAAFLILASAAFCKQKHLTPLFEVMDGVSVGIEPVNFGLGPVAATSKLLQRNQLTLAEIDRIELNEAFAAQTLACITTGHWPLEKINLAGGALAFGHPFGATGAILTRRLMTELQRAPQASLGLVTMCVGGGQGSSLLLRKRA